MKPAPPLQNFISNLIKKLNEIPNFKDYTKEKTMRDFVIPLFSSLGWEFDGKNPLVIDVNKISKDRADFAFQIDGITKFFLKIVPLSENIDDKKWLIPVTTYAFNKGITWAIVTNFQKIKVLNSEVKGKSPSQMQFFELSYNEFISKYDRLAYLLKKSFELDILDKEAEFFSKKQKKTPIDKQLLEDLLQYSKILSKDIQNNNSKNFSVEEIDESVHKILNRLIFIRACGDRELEKKHLISNLREWEETKDEKLIKYLRKIFNYFEENYGGTIFSNHLCDKLEISDSVLQKTIDGLYMSEDKSIQYDFSIIESDVLGQMYEQYLRFFRAENKTNVKTDRKKHGIFYTPGFVVDYIVKNTLGELVQDKKIDYSKVRILDLACGSGSFLIKAYDFLYDHYLRKDRNFHQTLLSTDIEGGVYSKKVQILKENLFGVDLDKIATEIIQLNLLLKITEKKHHLPILQQNIRHGNSVVDSKKIDPLAFTWKDEFHQIINEDEKGFDIIIGNPPYVSIETLSKNNRDMVKFLKKEYFDIAKSHWDLFVIFIMRSLTLLKKNGYCSFIVPSTFAKEKYATELRKLIIKDYSLIKLVDFGVENVFSKVARQYIIFVIQNKINKKNITKIISFKKNKFEEISSINQIDFLQFYNCTFRTNITKLDIQLRKKIFESSVSLGNICCINSGIEAQSGKNSPKKFKKEDVIYEKYSKGFKKYVEGKDLERYSITWNKKYVDYDNNKEFLHRSKFPELFENKKIIIRAISGEQNRLLVAYDEDKFYSNHSCNHLILWTNEIEKLQGRGKIFKDNGFKDKVSLLYLTGILNSKLMSYYFSKFFATGTLQGTYSTINPGELREFPIKIPSKEQEEEIVELVKKITSKMKNRKEQSNINFEKNLKESEEIDQKIDLLVYTIYNISDSEKEIIEASL